MKEVGVGLILRKAGNMTVPTLIIDIENEKWSVKIRSTFKNSDDEFFIGVEKDDGKSFVFIFYAFTVFYFNVFLIMFYSN